MSILTNISMMTAWDSFVKLFTEMSAVVWVLFIVGIILSCIEMLTPGFGVFGGVGIAAIVAAIIVRMVQGGDLWMLFYMLLIATALFITLILVVSRSIKKGKLSKSDMFNVDSSVPVGHTESTKNYTYLLGCRGKSLTMLRPIGQANINGEILDVVANNGFIDEDSDIEVIFVEGITIKVKQL